jgi:hypothetical protein
MFIGWQGFVGWALPGDADSPAGKAGFQPALAQRSNGAVALVLPVAILDKALPQLVRDMQIKNDEAKIARLVSTYAVVHPRPTFLKLF